MDRICGMTVHHNIDTQDVNVFMAGSSCLLLQELGLRRLHGINREIVNIEDPSEKDITQYLENKLGYSPEACKRIIERLGCRLRILSRVLESKLSDEELDNYINNCHKNAILDIKTLFATCSDIKSRLQVSKILNDLSMGGKRVMVELSDLPLELQNHKIVKVFYVDSSLGIVIQRVPIRNAWLEIKNGDNFTK
jgi:translation initiation factor RLI1